MLSRLFTLSSAVLLGCTLQTAKAGKGRTTTEKKRPNILFCIADDAGLLGAYGTRWLHTPAFDRVAGEGILFNKAFTCNAKSAPSRAAIITGRNSWQLEEACNHWPQFPVKFKSYVEVLGENGYTVGCTGKGWGPGYAKDSEGKARELTGKGWNRRHSQPPAKGISSIDYAANFRDFMENRDTLLPFFFWYGAMEPHRAYEFNSSSRFNKKTSEIDHVPAYWPDTEKVRRDMLDYAVEVEHFDRHLGEMLRYLEETGELDNTLIIVTSDHNMPFPRRKGQAYFQSNQIPMAVMWKKGLLCPGRESDDFISVIDIAPTLLELAGIDSKHCGMQPITGRSFTDILRNRQKGKKRNTVLVGKERHDVGRPDDQGYPIRGLVSDSLLYIRNYKTDRWPACNPETGYMNIDGSPTKTEILTLRREHRSDFYWKLSCGKRPEEELYNIRRDPECMHNLMAEEQYRTAGKRLRKEMERRLKKEGDPRMYGEGDIFDRYPNTSYARQYYNRTRAGEKVSTRWVNKSDFEKEPVE